MANIDDQPRAPKDDRTESGPSSFRKFLKKLVKILKHPFVLLVVGTIITSLLIPPLTSKINRSQSLQEARLNKAIEIGNHNTEFNSKLNALKTMLASFHSQNVRLRLQPVELREAQLKFRDDFNKRYLELDEKAWWWYTDLEREASVLNLTAKNELPQLDVELHEYGDNVQKSLGILRPLWRALTSHDYDPNNEESRKKVEKIIADVDDPQTGMPPLFQARNNLVDKITRHFTPPQ